ncbi:expressed protein, partial [Phakopsora pachyrhizi]
TVAKFNPEAIFLLLFYISSLMLDCPLFKCLLKKLFPLIFNSTLPNQIAYLLPFNSLTFYFEVDLIFLFSVHSCVLISFMTSFHSRFRISIKTTKV